VESTALGAGSVGRSTGTAGAAGVVGHNSLSGLLDGTTHPAVK
jgi:hypothetical protein